MITPIGYDINEICSAVKGSWICKAKSYPLKSLSLDSRKIIHPANTIFWAIKTNQRDASKFISPLYKKGVRNFVTQSKVKANQFPGANIILVADTIDALQMLAAYHRKKHNRTHVIGITGSNGKTVVKDWLHLLLSRNFEVMKSPKSFNSQIGVALSILQIRPQHQFAIIEAGISRPGEMEKLEKMIRPDSGIFTNIGVAHDEGFKNEEQKINEKLTLFKRSTSLVYPGEQQQITKALKNKVFKNIKIFNWAKEPGNLLKIKSIRRSGSHSNISVQVHAHTFSFSIPFTDKGSIQNAINCFAELIATGTFKKDMLPSFRFLYPVSMRLEMKPGQHGCIIINDSYSNDLQSLSIALGFLKQQLKSQHTVILSDILESGLKDPELYNAVASLLREFGVDQLIGIGKNISASKALFSEISKKEFFPDTASFLSHLPQATFNNEAILVKGARKFLFEKISSALEAQVHQTVLSMNLSNLAHNINVYKSLLKPGVKIMAMVKAFAYGSGSNEIASLLQFTGVDHLAVAYVDEGVALRQSGITLPIMVMNSEADSFEQMIKNKLEPEIFSFKILSEFSSFLSRHHILAYPIHVKLDTGMHRLGFEEKDINELTGILKRNKNIRVRSVFSHLSSADDDSAQKFTLSQFNTFKKLVSKIKDSLKYQFDTHISNTSAISRHPQFNLEMVRLGIGMYGIDSNTKIKSRLRVVNQLKTTISQIKELKAGETVGYGRTSVLKKDSIIATVGIGYADGYSRILGNGKGKMLINGQLVSTVGNICMDMTMLDVTKLKSVKEGDEVTVFGNDPSIEKVAEWAETIPYEILSGISQRVKRVYFEE